jgi:uncharacterized membrane protein
MNKILTFACVISFATVFAVSCNSADLGSEKQPEIAVNATNPTFEADIAAVMTAKCSTCHALPRSKFAPGTTPTDDANLDKLTDKTAFAIKASRIKTRVFDTPENPMPPHFATPLTDSEKAALKVYLAEVEIANSTLTCTAVTPNLTYQDVKSILTPTCETCHGGTYPPDLNSLQLMKANRINAYNQILNKDMPQSNKPFHDTPERVKLLDWLCEGSDVK